MAESTYDKWGRLGVPGPPATFMLGNVPNVGLETPVQRLTALAAEYGPLMRLKFPSASVLVVTSADLAREVCDDARFHKRLVLPLEHLRQLAGAGLFTAQHGEPEWGKAHRVLRAAFGPAALAAYHDAMLDIAEQLLHKWARSGPDAALDVSDDMTRLTLDTIALCGFGYRFNSFYSEDMHGFVESMFACLRESNLRGTVPGVFELKNAVSGKPFEQHIDRINAVVDTVIAARQASGETSTDLLGRMLAGVDPETGETLDAVNIRHQVITFLIAGHETTSGLLSFAMRALLDNPDVLAAVKAEVDAAFGPDRRMLPTFDQVAKLDLVDRVLQETLRLWPTAPAFALTPKAPTTLGDIPLEPGDRLMVLLPQLHRDPDVWDAPDTFDPDRFLPEATRKRPKRAFLPFGQGMRACIGRFFAMHEAKLVLATVLHRFDLEDASAGPTAVKETLTLKPVNFKVHAHRRSTAALVVPKGTPDAHEALNTGLDTPGASDVHREGAPPVLVLFGSNMGAGENLAGRLARHLRRAGYTPHVSPLDAAHAAQTAAPAGAAPLDRLPADTPALVICASYNGAPPDNAAGFFAWATEGDAAFERAFAQRPFAVLGTGHRDWTDTYMAVPTALDHAMAAAGGTRLLERHAADASGDFFGAFRGWQAAVTRALVQALPPGSPHRRAPQASPDAPVSTAPHAPKPAPAAFVVRDRQALVADGHPGKHLLHLECPPDVTYKPGDHLAVHVSNAPDVVGHALRSLGVRGTAPFDPAAPDGPTWHHVLTHDVACTAPPSADALAVLAAAAACPPDAARAATWHDPAHAPATLWDALDAVPSALAGGGLTAAAALDLLPPLLPRMYSIASDPAHTPDHLDLLVAHHTWTAADGTPREGLASSQLARAVPGSLVRGVVKSPNTAFAPPAPGTAALLIAAGAGYAPFRGFLQHHAARGAPDTWHLFFGCRAPDVDDVCATERADWAAAGWLVQHRAYSRAPGHPRYVQDVLLAKADLVRTHVAAGGAVYMCGDGARLAPAVRAALEDILASMGGLGALRDAGRYFEDVFAS